MLNCCALIICTYAHAFILNDNSIIMIAKWLIVTTVVSQKEVVPIATTSYGESFGRKKH